MSKSANQKNATDIQEGIKEFITSFQSNNPELSGDAGLGNTQFNSVFGFIDAMRKDGSMNFVPDKQRAEFAQPVQGILVNIHNMLTKNTANNGTFDYDNWREGMGKLSDQLSQKLDAFNKATDYEYIGAGPMRLLQKFSDRLSQMDLKIQSRELGEDMQAAEYKANVINQANRQINQQGMAMESFCQYIQMTPSTATEFNKNNKAIGDLANENARKGRTDIVSTEMALYEATGKSIEVFGLLLQDSLYENRGCQLKTENIRNQLADDEKNLSDMMNNKNVPQGLKAAITGRMQLENFLETRPASENLDAFKAAFIQQDPLGMFGGVNRQEAQRRTNMILGSDKEGIDRLIRNSFDNMDKTINSFRPSNPKEVNNFSLHERHKQELNLARAEKAESDKIVQFKMEFLRKTEMGKKRPDVIETFIQKASDAVLQVNTEQEVQKRRGTLQQNITNHTEKNLRAQVINKELIAHKDAFSFHQRVSDAMQVMQKNQFEPLGKMKKGIEQSVNDLQNKCASFSKTKEFNKVEKAENTMQEKLNRFSEQLNQCKRSGHIDTKEFTALKTALENAKNDMSPKNFEALSTAADDYLVKKGTRNPFASKMRLHRIDMAKSISSFAKECRECTKGFENAKPIANNAKQALQNAQGITAQSIENKIDKKLLGNNGIANHQKEIRNNFHSIGNRMTAMQNEASLAKELGDLGNLSFQPATKVNNAPKVGPQVGGP